MTPALSTIQKEAVHRLEALFEQLPPPPTEGGITIFAIDRELYVWSTETLLAHLAAEKQESLRATILTVAEVCAKDPRAAIVVGQCSDGSYVVTVMVWQPLNAKGGSA